MEKAVAKAINFLKREVKKGENFGMEESFPTMIILESLCNIVGAESIRKEIARWLRKQLTAAGTFNYWIKDSKNKQTTPFPDDMDDLALGWVGLYHFNSQWLTGNDLSKIVNCLILNETEEGGPYQTWIVPPENRKDWSEIDLGVNANIGYFLKSQKVELPKINNLIESKISHNDYHSRYYDALGLIYFISRIYRGKHKSKLVNKLRREVKKNPSNQNLALAITSLLRLGEGGKINQAWLTSLIQNQAADGSWAAEGLYWYQEKKVGCRGLTTALVIESLHRYHIWQQDQAWQNYLNKYRQAVIADTNTELTTFPDDVKKVAEKLLREESDGIIMKLPLLVGKSLGVEAKVVYGKISLWGWIAYTLMDDIIDGVRGPELVPMVNLMIRRGEAWIAKLDQGEWWSEIFEKMDWGNYNEKIGKKYEVWSKSAGCLIVPILMAKEIDMNKSELHQWQNFWQNLLTARQMSDDIHDWEEDRARGQKTLAVKAVAKLGQVKNAEELRIKVWQEVVPEYGQKVLKTIQKARANLRKVTTVKEPKYVLEILNKVELGIKEALEERERVLEFSQSYCQK